MQELDQQNSQQLQGWLNAVLLNDAAAGSSGSNGSNSSGGGCGSNGTLTSMFCIMLLFGSAITAKFKSSTYNCKFHP
jgi:hypothetical protein